MCSPSRGAGVVLQQGKFENRKGGPGIRQVIPSASTFVKEPRASTCSESTASETSYAGKQGSPWGWVSSYISRPVWAMAHSWIIGPSASQYWALEGDSSNSSLPAQPGQPMISTSFRQ